MSDPTVLEAQLDLFNRLFEAPAAQPAALHRAAWAAAWAAGDMPLQQVLVARVDAPADLVARYANLTGAALRGAFLGRPDAGPAQLAERLAGETRATVLADALERTRNHPAVLAVAVEAFLARPTKALAGRLRTLPSEQVSPELAEAILGVYDRIPLAGSEYGAVEGYPGRLGPDRAARLLTELRHPDTLAAVMRLPVPDAAVTDALRRVADPVFTLVDGRPVVGWRALNDLIAAALTGRADPDGVADTLTCLVAPWAAAAARANAERVIAHERQRNRRSRGWLPGAGGRTTAPPAGAPDPAADLAAMHPSEIRTLARTPDPQVLAAIVARLVAQDPATTGWADSVLDRLLGHPLLTVSDRHALLAWYRAGHAGRPGHSHPLAKVDLVALFPDDEVARAIGCELYPQRVLERHGWAPFGGLDQAGPLLRAWGASERPEHREAVLEALEHGLPDPALLDLPMWCVQHLSRDYFEPGSAPEIVLCAVGRLLARHLGDDPDRWEVYFRLAPTFRGSFADLLSVARAAAAAVPA